MAQVDDISSCSQDGPDASIGAGVDVWEICSSGPCACSTRRICRSRPEPERLARPRPDQEALWRLVANQALAAGELVLRLEGATSCAWWPVSAPWLPPPRLAAERVANSEVRIHACETCRAWHWDLVTLRSLQPGEELLVAALPAVRFAPEDHAAWQISFDGGARAPTGWSIRSAGAAAVLWGPRGDDGARTPMRAILSSLPAVETAPAAEAHGLRLTFHLLREIPTATSASIVGDNVATVRFGNGTGMLRAPHLVDLVSNPLGDALQRGWRLRWLAVRRHLNKVADACATLAVLDALHRVQRGDRSARMWVLAAHEIPQACATPTASVQAT